LEGLGTPVCRARAPGYLAYILEYGYIPARLHYSKCDIISRDPSLLGT